MNREQAQDWLNNDSLFILAFDPDGRCEELVEWFMLQPAAAEGSD